MLDSLSQRCVILRRERRWVGSASRGKGGACQAALGLGRLALSMCLLTFTTHAESASFTLAADALRSWPQWRGPLANGVAPNANPPVAWSEMKNVRWKIPLPGQGHSSPIVFGDRVYLMAAAAVGPTQKPVFDSAPGVHDSVPVTQRHQYLVLAMNRSDGQIVWQKVVHEEWPHEGGHNTGSPASNSPVTDGKFIYAFFGSRGLYCLDLNGTVKWQKELGKMQTLHAHGEGSSPVLHGNSLIACWDHEGASFLYAFDKRSGQQLWRVARDEKTGPQFERAAFFWCNGVMLVKNTYKILNPGIRMVHARARCAAAIPAGAAEQRGGSA